MSPGREPCAKTVVGKCYYPSGMKAAMRNLLEPDAAVEGSWERETSRAYISFSLMLAVSTFIIGVFVLPPAQGVYPYWESSGFWIGILAFIGFSLSAHMARRGALEISGVLNVATILGGALAGSFEFPWAIVMASGALIVSGPLLTFRWGIFLAAVVMASPSVLLWLQGNLTMATLIPAQVPNTVIPIAYIMSARLHDRIKQGQLAYYREREAAELAKHQLEEELHEARKLESLGRLAGGVAHDFNNQLTVILGGCSLLESGVASDEMIHTIRKAAEHSGDLTEQLLTFSRKQPHQPTLLNITEVVRESEHVLAKLVAEHVALRLQLSGDELWIMGDLTQLQQVLFNLAGNASDSMPNGGEVVLHLGSEVARLESAPDHKLVAHAVLDVSDQGHGMDEETQERIFEPFFTTKQLGRGTGLGLATVYGIVRGAGGRVEVESTLGQGTRFRVYLPLSDARPAPPCPAPIDKSLIKGARILVVDDQAAVGEMVCANLRDIGAQPQFAHGPEAARNAVAEPASSFDLLITDVMMPETSGVDLAKEFGKSHPQMAVLFISGNTADLPLASRDLLTKPFTRDKLVESCARALAPHD